VWGGQAALLARQSATLIASPGAVAVARDLGTAGPPAADAQHAVRLRYTGFVGAGLAWRSGSTPQVDLASTATAAPLLREAGWHWQAGLQLLQLRRLVWRRIDGQVQFAAASGTYGFDVVSDQGDDRLTLPFQHGFAPRGVGVLLDAALMHCDGHRCFGAGLRDLGRLFWHGLPRERATLSTQTRTVDAEGFVVFEPLVQGHDSQESASQAAPFTFHLDARWRLAAAWQAGLRADWLAGYGWLPSAQLQWRKPQGLAWTAAWQVHERRLGVQAAGERWMLRVAADRLGTAARSREVALAWHLPL
jgi:hypothetical protein